MTTFGGSSDGPVRSATDRVYRLTKEAIISGAHRPGALLSANAMAELLGVSRTPVREALVRLEGEGLLELIPRRGAIVLPMSRTEARDVLDLRHALEVSAVARMAQTAVVADRLTAAVTALSAQRTCLDGGSPGEFPAHDESFHRALVAASGNELAARMYATLGDRQRRMTHAAAPSLGELEQMVEQHWQMYGLALEGDVDGFAAAHWEHVMNTHRALVGDEGPPAWPDRR